MAGGLVPLLPFLTSIPHQTASNASIVSSAAALFIVGALRTRITGRRWWHSGLEMLFVGALAGSVAYAAGWGVHHLLSNR
jgi:vacuolar iron transporter family protein